MKRILSVLVFATTLICLLGCKSDQSKGEDLIRDHMYRTVSDFDSYEPIETDVKECNNTIWCNLRAISAAENVLEEYYSLYGNKFDYKTSQHVVWSLVKKHLKEFGSYKSLETHNLEGYMITQKFRIKDSQGNSHLTTMRYIVDKDFDEILAYYELPANYLYQLSIGYILNMVFDVYRTQR